MQPFILPYIFSHSWKQHKLVEALCLFCTKIRSKNPSGLIKSIWRPILRFGYIQDLLPKLHRGNVFECLGYFAYCISAEMSPNPANMKDGKSSKVEARDENYI